MFSFPSLSKLLLLVAIISAIWFGFRLLGQLDRQRKEVSRGKSKRGRDAVDPRTIEETVKCRVCGTFLAARGATACGKSGCPF
jgi:uncharacterized protein